MNYKIYYLKAIFIFLITLKFVNCIITKFYELQEWKLLHKNNTYFCGVVSNLFCEAHKKSYDFNFFYRKNIFNKLKNGDTI